MQYDQTIITPKGLAVHIRNGAASDGSAVFENFNEPFPKKWTRKMRKKQNEANRSE